MNESLDFDRNEFSRYTDDIDFDRDVVDELADLGSLAAGLGELQDVPAAYDAYQSRQRRRAV